MGIKYISLFSVKKNFLESDTVKYIKIIGSFSARQSDGSYLLYARYLSIGMLRKYVFVEGDAFPSSPLGFSPMGKRHKGRPKTRLGDNIKEVCVPASRQLEKFVVGDDDRRRRWESGRGGG